MFLLKSHFFVTEGYVSKGFCMKVTYFFLKSHGPGFFAGAFSEIPVDEVFEH